MENEELHNKMMSILRQKACMDEGEGDDNMSEECGGWARGHKLTEAEYVNAFKKRMGSAQKARAAYRRKYGLPLNKRKTKSKPKPKPKPIQRRRKRTQFLTWQQFLKKNAGQKLSLAELSDLYDYQKYRTGKLEGAPNPLVAKRLNPKLREKLPINIEKLRSFENKLQDLDLRLKDLVSEYSETKYTEYPDEFSDLSSFNFDADLNEDSFVNSDRYNDQDLANYSNQVLESILDELKDNELEKIIEESMYERKRKGKKLLITKNQVNSVYSILRPYLDNIINGNYTTRQKQENDRQRILSQVKSEIINGSGYDDYDDYYDI